MDDVVERLVAALREAERMVVVTGAGISAASGLPTFRGNDPDAIWSKDVTEIATAAYFRTDPVGWWRWFDRVFAGVIDAEPNDAHRAIARLEQIVTARGDAFLLVTQNVDLLHERAGSQRMVKIHGTADRLRCSQRGCAHGEPEGSLPLATEAFSRFREAPSLETIPRCPSCSALVRAHALLFDEFYTAHVDYGFDRAAAALETADLILFAGTSFSVGITSMALDAARFRRVRMMSIDPFGRPPRPVEHLEAPAESALPAAVVLLEGKSRG
ncbi:MAG: NAD-dependent deacetylase [Thermoanaerobaculia bacterium]